MKPDYRNLRLSQLDAMRLDAKLIAYSDKGWLRAIREALGLTQQQVAKAMNVKQQSVVDFEQAEADGRITLRNLKRVAEALDCELVYAIAPRTGTFTELAERKIRGEVRKRVQAVERTMALENQAVGGVEKLIDGETKRKIKKP